VDQLQKEGKRLLTAEDGQLVSEQIEAVKFIECSALTQENLPEVFTETIRAVITPDKGKEGAQAGVEEKPTKKKDGGGKTKPSKKDDGKTKKDTKEKKEKKPLFGGKKKK